MLDIQMPLLDGNRSARSSATAGIQGPIIAVSASALPSDVTRGTTAGFDAYLTKPIRPADLRAAVRRFQSPAGEPPRVDPISPPPRSPATGRVVQAPDRARSVTGNDRRGGATSADAVLADHVHDGIGIYDRTGRLVYWNAAATAITGWQISSPEAAGLRERPAGLAEIRPGKWIESRRVMLPWDGSPAEAVLFNDVTAERRLTDTHQQLRDIGLIDPLTGLIGERLLRDHARRSISLAQRDGRSAGVIWVELDRFIGSGPEATAAADEVMRQCAGKVERSIRASDLAARPEPETLAVMLTALRSSTDLRIIAVRLLLVLASPCFVEGRERSVAATAGGAVFPLNGEDPEVLIAAARGAARQARATGEQLVLAGEP